jgi:3-hydroxyisobutyrate dehydrogenase-like beta-hydroxyacid dehydrogenase
MKVCVIGVGRMGRRHIAAARGAGFELAGVFDQSPEALATTLSECDVEKDIAFSNASQMLAAARPDAVVISTTAPSHCDFVCAAVAGVRHPGEADGASSRVHRMVAACRAAGKLAVVIRCASGQYRHQGAYRYAGVRWVTIHS